MVNKKLSQKLGISVHTLRGWLDDYEAVYGPFERSGSRRRLTLEMETHIVAAVQIKSLGKATTRRGALSMAKDFVQTDGTIKLIDPIEVLRDQSEKLVDEVKDLKQQLLVLADSNNRFCRAILIALDSNLLTRNALRNDPDLLATYKQQKKGV